MAYVNKILKKKIYNNGIIIIIILALIGFGLTTFVVGAIGGFYRSPRTKELQGKPIPRMHILSFLSNFENFLY